MSSSPGAVPSMLTSGISSSVTDSFSPGTAHLKNTNKNMVRTTYGKIEYLCHVMYPGHSLVSMLSTLLKVRRAWEQGRHVVSGLHHRCAQRIKYSFLLCNHGNRHQFCQVFLINQYTCFLLCAHLLAEIGACTLQTLFSQILASFWMKCNSYFTCHFLHNLHRIL